MATVSQCFQMHLFILKLRWRCSLCWHLNTYTSHALVCLIYNWSWLHIYCKMLLLSSVLIICLIMKCTHLTKCNGHNMCWQVWIFTPCIVKNYNALFIHRLQYNQIDRIPHRAHTQMIMTTKHTRKNLNLSYDYNEHWSKDICKPFQLHFFICSFWMAKTEISMVACHTGVCRHSYFEFNEF